MKKRFATIGFTILACVSLAFMGTYGGELYDDAVKITAVSDGFLTVGYTEHYDEPYYQMLAIKLDLEGKLLWERELGTKFWNDFGYDVLVDGDGNYLFLGTGGGDSGYDQFFLLKTDLNGNTIWQKTYGKGFDYSARAFTEVSDGYVVVGQTQTNKDYLQASAVKFDRYGRKIWERNFGKKDFDIASDVLCTDEGNLLLTGSSWIEDHQYLLLVLLEPSGKTIWEKIYGDETEPHLEGTVIVPESDGYVIGGKSSDFASSAFFMMINDEGDVIWTTTTSDFYPGCVDMVKDGEDFVAVTPYVTVVDEGFALIRIDSSGKVLKYLTDLKEDREAHSLTGAADGKFIVTGILCDEMTSPEIFWKSVEF